MKKEELSTMDLIIESSTQSVSPWYYVLNGELIKQLKPCNKGDQIHIHKWEGCYTVHWVNVNGFRISKNREFYTLPWSEFRCKRGAGNSPEKHQKNLRREFEADISLCMILLKSMLNKY